ncbi:N-acyl homoserine lactonase family protein [Nocardia sp. NPDC005366]|uniref:N-acyl homoserine lactonase family protein n=1 Tax=Nocardia sp. NPDC005366 TaxID=3156878 RepID=UPI0033A94076
MAEVRVDTAISPFEVYAIRLAVADRLACENFLHGAGREGTMALDFDMWVLRRGSMIAVVDTGFSEHSSQRRGRTLERTPAEAVRTLGIDPGAVGDVVLTHLHYDHAGGLDDFPAARVWLQERELAYTMGPSMRHPSLNHFFEVEDLIGVLRRIHAGAVSTVDGPHAIAPGLELHLIGGHTRGLQIVRVWTERGWVVLASDALHYYANFEERDPFPAIVDLGEMLDGYDTIVSLADTLDHIIPGHDPQVMNRYDGSGLPAGVVALHRPPSPPE